MSIVGLVVTAAMSLVLIPAYGASGAAIASAVGYAAGGVAAWLSFTRLVSRGAGRDRNTAWKSTGST